MSLKWNRVLSSRAPKLLPTPFEDVYPLQHIEDMVYFAGGAPPQEFLPVHRIRQSLADVWEDPGTLLHYGESQGNLALRQVIAERMVSRGANVDPADVMITNGSQQGLDLIARALFDSGDVIAIEGPTYFGALQAFDAYDVRYRTVPVDDDGLIPDALEESFRESPAPKALYTIPTFQNPTGVSISPERRKRIIELSHQYNIPIIEDDPYGELHFPGNTTGPLRALDDQVIYLGTFSKTLAPALRIGWMVMPGPLQPALTNSKEAVDVQSDRLLQRAIVSAVSDGWLDIHLDSARELYAARCKVMLDALESEMPFATRWGKPLGGFFVWVQLPDELPGTRLLPFAAKHGVAFLPGSGFYPDLRPEPALRLGFSVLSEDRIAEGIQRLGMAVREALESL